MHGKAREMAGRNAGDLCESGLIRAGYPTQSGAFVPTPDYGHLQLVLARYLFTVLGFQWSAGWNGWILLAGRLGVDNVLVCITQDVDIFFEQELSSKLLSLLREVPWHHDKQMAKASLKLRLSLLSCFSWELLRIGYHRAGVYFLPWILASSPFFLLV